jgi:hypothetical protein
MRATTLLTLVLAANLTRCASRPSRGPTGWSIDQQRALAGVTCELPARPPDVPSRVTLAVDEPEGRLVSRRWELADAAQNALASSQTAWARLLAMRERARVEWLRGERDGVTVACVGDLLIVARAELCALAAHERLFRWAAGAGDEARARHEATLLRTGQQRVQNIVSSAGVCLGEDGGQFDRDVLHAQRTEEQGISPPP